MIGSIIGDIVGSVYEFHNIKTKDFPLFTSNKTFTDDTILSVATADWLMKGGEPKKFYSKYARRYKNPMGGYGSGFLAWTSRTIKGDYTPYNSCGNGAAMRVGPVGWAFNTKEEILTYSKITAECTHNHPEGIKGAQATALAIWMARNGASKEKIRDAIEKTFDYQLNFTCDSIRESYSWGGTCQESVPQAIVAFLDGVDFEDCIRNAISIGGDSDTIGCITGSIAEAFYPVPTTIYEQGLSYLTPDLKQIVLQFESMYADRSLGKNFSLKSTESDKKVYKI